MIDFVILELFRLIWFLLSWAGQYPFCLVFGIITIWFICTTGNNLHRKWVKFFNRKLQHYFETRQHMCYGYNMTTGPHTWIADTNCQSPINIDEKCVQKFIIRELLNWNHYDDLPENITLENTGHTLIVRAKYYGNRPTLSGADLLACYTFVEMRFRWSWCNNEGSEHTLNNRKYPLELQVMHRTGAQNSMNISSYDLLMIAYIFELAPYNPYLDPIVKHLRLVRKPGKVVNIPPFPLSYVVHQFRTGFYSYGGSLTEPPCYQGTEWFVFPVSLAVTEYQLRQFRKLLSSNGITPIECNARPVQKLNNRLVRLNQFHSCINYQIKLPQPSADTTENHIEEIDTTTIITTTNANSTKVNTIVKNAIDNPAVNCGRNNSGGNSDTSNNNYNKNNNNILCISGADGKGDHCQCDKLSEMITSESEAEH